MYKWDSSQLNFSYTSKCSRSDGSRKQVICYLQNKQVNSSSQNVPSILPTPTQTQTLSLNPPPQTTIPHTHPLPPTHSDIPPPPTHFDIPPPSNHPPSSQSSLMIKNDVLHHLFYLQTHYIFSRARSI